MAAGGQAAAGTGAEAPPARPPAPPALRAHALFAWLEPAVEAVEGCRLEAVRDDGGDWFGRPGVTPEAAAHAVAGTPESAGPLAGRAWTGVFDLARGDGAGALMVVSAGERPRPARLLRLGVLGLHHRVRTAVAATAALCERAHRLAAGVESVVAENDSLRRLHRAQRQVAAAVATGGGPSGVVRALGEATGRTVAVWDGGVQLAAFTPEAAAPPPDEPALPTPLAERRAFRNDGWLYCAVRSPDGALAVVGVADPDGAVDGVGTALVEDAAAVAAQELALARAGRPAARAWEDLARELLRGEDAAAAQLAAPLGYDLDRPHQVAVVSCDPPAPRLVDAVRWAARAQDGAVLALGSAGEATVVTASRLDWAALAARLREHLQRPRLLVGTSGWREQARRLADATREAEWALKLVAGAGGSDGVAHFDDLGVLRMLAAGGDTAELRRYVECWLGPLLDSDARRGSELVRTLAVYWESGGSVARSADALIIHPSTVKYRLARVGELTGLDLNDPDTRFQLQLAERARATLAALGGEPHRPAPAG